MTEGAPDYWLSRFVFERALAAVYLIAFLGAANQSWHCSASAVSCRCLASFGWCRSERRRVSFSSRLVMSPFGRQPGSASGWRALALSGYPQQWGTVWSATVWAALWVLYLSFVNVGQTFYAFGWESLLLETGFLAIFAGGSETTPNILLIWMWRWVLFRDMFGAGLIKLRGDPCWRDLTCLHYYFETRPIPNPLSWYFHWLPRVVHRAGVAFNHVVELAVPFLYFAPQPLAAIGGLLTILFQLTLIVSGNLSWLNWITIVLCIPTLDDRWWAWLPVTPPVLETPAIAHRVTVAVLAAIVLFLSMQPNPQHAVTAPVDELFIQSPSHHEYLRRLREHHTDASRDRHRGHE